ncbi:glycosyltransferase [Arthrobacter sp. zg-Y1110]|uniref:glycosyltransferase n=1 Tax=Arthrobacter sp. zg-Y1110 TaxID=2886932 RepID=UPI001D13C60D|nr:glycosyltransferase [Arthrobacter sp. zg-Y1110]MCC3289646.1 glycosyltransferase [Arthrobacter sp. zg-Y1110]UWX84931.1 glycosyltransferase [Arthrobacter sp. zg-Y1110]
MRILLWHVHGGWMEAFVRGAHEYLLPATPARDAWGLGRGGRSWPAAAVEVAPEDLRTQQIDVVLLQRPEEIDACTRLLGRRPGRDIPAVYLEHNTPRGNVPETRHPLAGRTDIPVVHVTQFNRLFWDTGRAPVRVIEHGIPDPGYLYTGERPHLGVVVNEPVRRSRVAGTDLLPEFARAAPLEVFGMGTERLPGLLGADRLLVRGDLPVARLHRELAGCRAYLHPMRWTSLGLSLLEAMHLGLPVLALATTEAVRAVPPVAGITSNDPEELARAARMFLAEPEQARACGRAARAAALARYGLDRFLSDWDRLFADLLTETVSAASFLPAAGTAPASTGGGQQ